MKRLYWKLRLWTKLAIIAIGYGGRLIEFCKNCGRKQPVIWHAPDGMWEAFRDGENVLCPECFDANATAKHFLLMWEPRILHTPNE